MFIRKIEGPRCVTLPDGTVMTRADLPDINTRRWVASRKAAVVKAVLAGLISTPEALKMYRISPEEFESWKQAIAEHGIVALKATNAQIYRQP